MFKQLRVRSTAQNPNTGKLALWELNLQLPDFESSALNF